MIDMKKFSKSLRDTEEIAEKILELIYKKENISATIIGLYGNLGAGKTTLTQAIGKILNIKENITSPTFVIMKGYHLLGSSFQKLIHIDAYRLEKEDELLKLGWAEIISNPKNLVIVEWPENVQEIMPDNHLKIKIKHLDESSREFEVCDF